MPLNLIGNPTVRWMKSHGSLLHNNFSACTHRFIFKEELLVSPWTGPRHLKETQQCQTIESDVGTKLAANYTVIQGEQPIYIYCEMKTHFSVELLQKKKVPTKLLQWCLQSEFPNVFFKAFFPPKFLISTNLLYWDVGRHLKWRYFTLEQIILRLKITQINWEGIFLGDLGNVTLQVLPRSAYLSAGLPAEEYQRCEPPGSGLCPWFWLLLSHSRNRTLGPPVCL